MSFTPEQITEILQIYFDNFVNQTYTGMRYVPIFGRRGEVSIDWDNSEPYEPLTIVTYNNESYTSRQFVPAGASITDTDYWAKTGAYNAQIIALQDALPIAQFDSENTVKDYIDELGSFLPASDFDNDNTVKAYIDEVADLLPSSAFDSVNTVRGAINEVKDVIPYSSFDDAHTVKDYIDANIDEINNIFKNGMVAIAKNRAYDAENGTDWWLYASYDGVNFCRIKKLENITGSSTFLKKIGEWYYLVNGKGYQKSKDLITWSERVEINIPEVTALNNEFWAGSILDDTNTDKYYFWVSYLYDNTSYTNGIGETDTTNHHVIYFEIEFDSNGDITRPDATINTFQNSAQSYIDPVCIYKNNYGYILAVKNEVTELIEIWTGTSLASLTKKDILPALYGVEAPQLIDNGSNVILYADAFDPRVCGADEYNSFSSHIAFNRFPAYELACCIYRKGSLASYARWNLVSFGNTVSHPSFLITNSQTINAIADGNIQFNNSFETREQISRYIPNADCSADVENYLVFTNHPHISYGIGGIANTKSVTLSFKDIFNNVNAIPLYFIGKYTVAATLKLGTGFMDVTANDGWYMIKPSMDNEVGIASLMPYYHYDPTNEKGRRIVVHAKKS